MSCFISKASSRRCFGFQIIYLKLEIKLVLLSRLTCGVFFFIVRFNLVLSTGHFRESDPVSFLLDKHIKATRGDVELQPSQTHIDGNTAWKATLQGTSSQT